MFGTYCRLGVHVWATNRAVIRAARTKLNPAIHRPAAFREARHAFYRQMLEYHRAERDLVQSFRL